MKKLKVNLKFIEDVLGTASANSDIHAEFIASKAPDAESRTEEIEAIGVEAAVEKAMTIFPKTADGNPFFWDYQIRGFFKEAIGALKGTSDGDFGKYSRKIKAHKKKVDNLIFVEPRQIPVDMHGMKIGNEQRPLRCSTAQGERISLANSEVIPEGAEIAFTVICFNDDDIKAVEECLEYGKYKGLGQWRNSGKGRFTAEYAEVE